MQKVSAHAVRVDGAIEITISGQLPDSCHVAHIQDIYPGGSIVYVIDPGAAQVFIEETVRTGSRYCQMVLVPWVATTSIPDEKHTKVQIFVNKEQVLEVPIVECDSEFIAIALTGTHTGCSVVPTDALYPAIYSKTYGPASYEECRDWVAGNCGV